MTRFVLKRQRTAEASSISEISRVPGLSVIEQINDQALLVEADSDVLKENSAALTGWTIGPETYNRLPKFHFGGRGTRE